MSDSMTAWAESMPRWLMESGERKDCGYQELLAASGAMKRKSRSGSLVDEVK